MSAAASPLSRATPAPWLARVAGEGPPLLMGVVNVTPDSFSDGGRFCDPVLARDHALALSAEGADIIDVGGESTRPGADPVSETEELQRILLVIEGVRARCDAVISVDTSKPAVAREAFGAGADIWNDVRALQEEGAVETAAALGAPVILMHMQGAPRSMQGDPRYDDVVAEVAAFLAERVEAAVAVGVARERLLVDPGIGFGKTLEHNLALLRGVPAIAQRTGRPVAVGASRKRFIAGIDPSAREESDRLGGSLAAALWAAQAGARVIRTHDVRETAQALAVRAALEAKA